MSGQKVGLFIPQELVTDVVDALVFRAYQLAVEANDSKDKDGSNPVSRDLADRSLRIGSLHRELSASALAVHGSAY